ncbi:MAG: hypothetical protein CL424_13965 [Acidimicrobiaceae bacterium]|nr:hypothetical protein [Acidimicrobiaceae bacterium]
MNPHDGHPEPSTDPNATDTEGADATSPGQADPTRPPSEQVQPTDDATTEPGELPALPDTDRALDLGRVARDLDGVEAALRRLDDGSYWTDEVTGEPLPDEVLAADPVARRVGP